MGSEDCGWGTQSEIRFVRGLGEHRNKAPYGQPTEELTQRDLLIRYRQSMVMRKRWGNVDHKEILKEVNRLLGENGGRET